MKSMDSWSRKISEAVRKAPRGTETFAHAPGWKSKLAVAFAILFSVVVCFVFYCDPDLFTRPKKDLVKTTALEDLEQLKRIINKLTFKNNHMVLLL